MGARLAVIAASVAAGALAIAAVGARAAGHLQDEAADLSDLVDGYVQALGRLDPELLSVLAAEVAWDEWPLEPDRYDDSGDTVLRMSPSVLRQLMEASAAAGVARVIGALDLGLRVGTVDLPDPAPCN